MSKHIIATLAAAAALSTGLSLAPMSAVAAPQPSRTVTPMDAVPNSRCAPIGHLYNGLCFGYTADGKQIYNWLGTYDSPAGPGWGLDYIYTTGFGSGASGTGWPTQNAFGSKIGTDEMAALSRLTKMNPPSLISNIDSAAIALIVREVMGDGSSPSKGQIIPGGLKVGGTVQKTDRLAIPASVYKVAQEQWDAASTYRSPIKLKTTTSETQIGPEATATVSIRASYGSGEKLPGESINLSYDGLTGPSKVSTDQYGVAKFTVNGVSAAPAPGDKWHIYASVEEAPAVPKIWSPSAWSSRTAEQYPATATRIITSQTDATFPGEAQGPRDLV